MATDETQKKPKKPDGDSGQSMTLDQNEIDSLFQQFNLDGDSREANADESPEESGPAPAQASTPLESSDDSAVSLDQNAIDALLSSSPETGSEGDSPNDNPEPDPTGSGQASPIENGPAEGSGATLDQNAIDALLNSASAPQETEQDQTAKASPPAGSSPDLPDAPASADENEVMSLDQDELDRLFKDYSEDNEIPDPAPGEANETAREQTTGVDEDESDSAAGDTTLDQGAIDQLFQDVDPDGSAEEIEEFPDPDVVPGADEPEPSEIPKATEQAAPQSTALDLETVNDLFADMDFEEMEVEVEEPLPPDLTGPGAVIKSELPGEADESDPDSQPEPLPGLEAEPPEALDSQPRQEIEEILKEEVPTLLEQTVPQRRLGRWIWLAGILIVVALGGGIAYLKYFGPRDTPTAVPPKTHKITVPIKTPAPQETQPATPEPPPPQNEPGSPEFIMGGHIAAIADLAKLLRIKREEIVSLQDRYVHNNIEAARTIRESARRQSITTLAEALPDYQLRLNLRTIQRRQAYAAQLRIPLAWVERAIAELEYVHHKISIDLELLKVIKNYDLTANSRLVEDALARNQPSAESFNMAVDAGQFRPLENIWDEIFYVHERQGFDRKDPNFAIWQEICDGEYRRVTELTGLSPVAAQCLTERSAPDLFLNNIGKISAESVQILSRWAGRWLCLNGLQTMDAATARALFSWPGNRISLNGLKIFPPELALFIPQWSGKHLELMGLDPEDTPKQQESFKYLYQWQQQSGGRVYLPPAMETRYRAYAASLAPKPVKFGQGFYFDPEKAPKKTKD